MKILHISCCTDKGENGFFLVLWVGTLILAGHYRSNMAWTVLQTGVSGLSASEDLTEATRPGVIGSQPGSVPPDCRSPRPSATLPQ